ncbi:hypothetical protein EAG_10937 [Camponotus floridanus]|uniref:Uncharacterized protein n=1 Tax=Camponotus floridanus TaxID=104421 RepID=E2ALH8_CAMFO|nr:hypothetical protein EAG_10937 [Camponotus floridanus]
MCTIHFHGPPLISDTPFTRIRIEIGFWQYGSSNHAKAAIIEHDLVETTTTSPTKLISINANIRDAKYLHLNITVCATTGRCHCCQELGTCMYTHEKQHRAHFGKLFGIPLTSGQACCNVNLEILGDQ